MLVSGCERELPSGPTQAEVDAYWENVLAETWDNSSASQDTERPVIRSEGVLGGQAWAEALSQCIVDQGVLFRALSWSDSGGYDIEFDTWIDVPTRHEMDIKLYTCVALHPQDVATDGTLLSIEQMNYIYDYYQRWLVPCLAEHGAELSGDLLSRVSFIEQKGQWSPYFLLGALNDTERAGLSEACGPERPRLD